ncbi:DgyrCDS286 [Dimorphilus gyrociliatus]|uniref:DgyrCDS286 n=1 Tax=Dimorphilus gyrociliatus TaxID=2664684 RepID=A0A7I8V5W0_9ANNE|nr:DgyrCDS286 [Dimorphilus gyrociliatus]
MENLKENLQILIEDYNNEREHQRIEKRELNGELIAEGGLLLYWSVNKPLYLKQTDRNNEPVNSRNSYHFDNTSRHAKAEFRRRLSMINGHLYEADTSIFTPSPDDHTRVQITSLLTTVDVITLLCNKFQIINDVSDFCICIRRSSGETFVLNDDSYPLIEWLKFSADKNEYRTIVMNNLDKLKDDETVKRYSCLPEPALQSILKQFKIEYDADRNKVKNRFERYRRILEERISEISTDL